jgi:hypothetical protein
VSQHDQPTEDQPAPAHALPPGSPPPAAHALPPGSPPAALTERPEVLAGAAFAGAFIAARILKRIFD